MLSRNDQINVLLIGGGGREHALAAKLTESPRLGELWVTHPQNPGLAALGRPVDVPVDIREIYRLDQFCNKHGISLVVIGPEEPLAQGYADRLRVPGRLVFGPGADGAKLEADKAWSKTLMRAAAIPTAEARSFRDPQAAKSYVQSRTAPPVVKASGLAKGKGVVVAATIDEAIDAVDRIMVRRVYGEGGREVVIEERLSGPEVSIFALVDGRNIFILETAQDHKRLGDGDTGPNTGGMGAFCPSPLVDETMMERIQRQILLPTVDTLRREGIDYRGVLYAGLILTPGGPKVLEYNCRFGDPECQALMARLRSDLLELIVATCEGRLDEADVEWEPGASCCIVLASRGYPDEASKPVPIEGIDQAERMPHVRVYLAGAARDAEGRIVTAGGRVLGVTAYGQDVYEARQRAYAACEHIRFEGMTFRHDIAAPAMAARR